MARPGPSRRVLLFLSLELDETLGALATVRGARAAFAAQGLAFCRWAPHMRCHEIPRRGQGLYPLRRRRERMRVVPAREIHRVRGTERRRRRPGRGWDRAGGG